MADYLLKMNDTDYEAIKRAAKAQGMTVKDLFLEGAKVRSIVSLQQAQALAVRVAALDVVMCDILGNKGDQQG